MGTESGMTLNEIGLARGIDQSSAGHNYLAKYEQILTTSNSINKIVVIGATKPISFANTLAEFMPHAEILLIAFQPQNGGEETLGNVTYRQVESPLDAHKALSGFGPVDLIIEDGLNTRNQKRELLNNLIYHVRDKGTYIVEDAHAIHIDHLAQGGGPNVLDDIVGAWRNFLAPISVQDGLTPEEAGLSQAIHRVELDGKLIIVTKSGNHARKLREGEYLESPPMMSVLHTRPSRDFDSRANLRSNNCQLEKRLLKRSFNFPEVSLRVYQDVVAVPGQVYYQGSSVLSDSFRHFSRTHLKNRNLRDVTSEFSIHVSGSLSVTPGSYYALDSELPGHFGHVTSEVVSRLWGWHIAKREFPNLKALVSASKDGVIADWEYAIFKAAGINVDDIVVTDEPIRVERLIAATPMLSQPIGFHPEISNIWNAISDAIGGTRNIYLPEKIFVGRKPGEFARVCRNGDRVEATFVEKGYVVVHPEDLSFRDQVELFRNAKSVAGYGGSGMFNLMFAGEGKNVIVVASEAYDAVNEYLIVSALGGNISYFWCQPDIPHPESGWRLKSFMSDFEFDFERDGRLLDQVAS